VEEGLSQREIAKKYNLGSKSSVGRHLAYLREKGMKTDKVINLELPSIATGKVINAFSVADTPLVGTMTPSTVNTALTSETKEVEAEDQDGIDALIREQGDDPQQVEVTSKEVKSRELPDGKVVKSFRVLYKPSVVSSEEPKDIQGLFDRAVAAKPSKVRSGREDRALVVVWADPQTGKVDQNGGTPELIERIKGRQEVLREFAADVNASSAFFLDAADGIEGFENTGQQKFTNDLSLMEQVELETTFEMTTIQVLAETHENVEVAGVPSNHAAWREGKSSLGKPSDDWGIHIKRQMQKAFALNEPAFGHVNFQYPGPWDESMVVDVLGHGIALTHGHQVTKPELMKDWWAKQLQAGELWDAQVLLHGHFHHFVAKQDGRHPITKQMKYILGAPALDNGSAWVRNSFGATSDAGLMVFVVDRNTGFSLNSLAVL